MSFNHILLSEQRKELQGRGGAAGLSADRQPEEQAHH